MQLNYLSGVNTFQIAEVSKITKCLVSFRINSIGCQLSITIAINKLMSVFLRAYASGMRK